MTEENKSVAGQDEYVYTESNDMDHGRSRSVAELGGMPQTLDDRRRK